MTLKAHPYADIFPMIEGEAFAAFAEDVKQHGQREKIVLLDRMILDGRNRYAAAQLHDLPAASGDPDCFRDFDPATEGDPLDWVVSMNTHRRHMDDGQRAMVGARLSNMKQGERTDLEPSANLRKVDQATAAAMMNVKVRSLQHANVVLEEGSPELVRAVDHGRIPVSSAASAAKNLPIERQGEVAKMAEAGKSNAVRTVIKQSERNAREVVLGAKQKALPDKKYGIILEDPEWRFEVRSRETGLDRTPDQHYPTSDEAAITARTVSDIAADDCMLCMWTTDLARGIRVMEARGFTYKSYFVWVKDIVASAGIDLAAEAGGGSTTWYKTVGNAGMGFWNRDRDEILLIGTRGKFVAPAMGTQPESVIFAARPPMVDANRGRHSAKPDDIHRWIEANWPSLPKIELNARTARAGWDVWGYEAPEEIGSGVVATVDARGFAPNYDTPLSVPDEAAFQLWKAEHAPIDTGEDYDLRGAYLAGILPAKDGHWSDLFKKPNHPTFSVESIYAQDRPERAGRWDRDIYIPRQALELPAVPLAIELPSNIVKELALDKSPRWLQSAAIAAPIGEEMHANHMALVADPPDANSVISDLPGITGTALHEDRSPEEVLAAAKALVIQHQVGSASWLARNLGVDWAHATRLLNALQQQGVVSADDNRGKRTVLMSAEEA